MNLKFNLKLVSLFFMRLVEFAIVYVVCTWMWFNFPAPYDLWLVVLFIALYTGYFGVTIYNDYYELTRGEGEEMI